MIQNARDHARMEVLPWCNACLQDLAWRFGWSDECVRLLEPEPEERFRRGQIVPTT
jgi:hypothetical protein